MQDARDSRRNKNTPPLPPKKHGGKAGKTQQGEPTNPEEKEATRAGGRENAARGTPPTQRKHEAPLDARKEKQKPDEIAGGSTWKLQRIKTKCMPSSKRGRPSLKQTETNKHNKKNNSYLLSSVSPPYSCRPKSNKSWGTMQPPSLPFQDPKRNQNIQSRQGPKA